MSGSTPTNEPNQPQQTPQQPLPEIYIEINRDIPGGVTPEFNREKFVRATTEQLDQIGPVVNAASRWFAAEISRMVHRPSSFSVEFGIDIGAEGGIPFVTKGTIEANFKVSIEWSTKA
jgi:hypothetical protein